jgi:hypothetical protein
MQIMIGTNHYCQRSSTWDKLAAIAVLVGPALFSNSLAARTAVSVSAPSPFMHARWKVSIYIHGYGTCILFNCIVGDEPPEVLIHLRGSCFQSVRNSTLFSAAPLYPRCSKSKLHENKHVNKEQQ